MPAPRGVFALLASLLVAAATVAAAAPSGPAAIPSWPASGGLLLAELMTGGASPSDEYIEIANAGPADADLGGCEIVYVSASGATITRKVGFASPLALAPGQHLLVANSAGIYGPLADATYTGGLAADGGAVALRRADGSVIDAVGWGTAANSYVEGSAAAAPPARSSIERLPGSSGRNSQDTNDNRADWFVQPNPNPQPLPATPVPSLSASPSPTSTPTSSATDLQTAPATPGESPSATPRPSATPAVTATPEPTATAAPTAAPTATAAATATPPASSPSAVPTISPSPTPTASPPVAPALETIAAARAEPAGARAHIAGVVTVGPGLVGSDVLFAIQDQTAGVFVRLPAAAAAAGPPIGTFVELVGTVSAPYGQVEVRDLESLDVGAVVPDPSPAAVALVDVGEATEGSLVSIGGTVSSVQTDGERITVTVVDGTTSVKVLADPPSGLSRSDVVRGDVVRISGIVGQRASATGRLDGYRVWLRRQVDLVVANPDPTIASSSQPRPPGSVVYRDLAAALKIRGAVVDFEAAVTAPAGLLDIGNPTIVVDDGATAVAVILPDGADAMPVGMRVHVTGKVGRWESGPTVLASTVAALGDLRAVSPRTVSGGLTDSLEWRLVRACGRIERFVRAGARWRVDIAVGRAEVSVLGEPAAAISVDKSSAGRLVVVTGIVRRSSSDSSVFELFPRNSDDFRLGPTSGAVPATAGGSPGTAGRADASGFVDTSVPIGSLSEYLGRTVTVSGLVTETSDSTATLDDGTGEVRLGGPPIVDALSMLQPGDAIEATGLVAQDDVGLIVQVDPESMIQVPGAADSGSEQDGRLTGLVDSSPRPSAQSKAAAATMPRGSSGGLPPQGAAVVALLVLFGLAAVAIATGFRTGRLRLPVARTGLTRSDTSVEVPD